MRAIWPFKKSSSSNDETSSQNPEVVIAVMGVTGAGKSSFIALASGQGDVEVGHNLYSETSEVKAYRFSHGSTNYVLVDTPGFDDSSMSNEEVATKIIQWLESSYRSGTRLNGIIYIHDIKKSRMQGSAYQNMRLFRKLCGDAAIGNVILATSFWDQVTESVGAEREHELKTSKDFWANMVAKGSEVVRIRPDRSVYLEVLEKIAAKNKIGLLVQEEIVLQNKTAQDTTAGKDAISRSNEIQAMDKTMEKERQAEKKRLKNILKEGEKAHRIEMKQLHKEQKATQREAKQTQRRSKKEHKRTMREDKRQMKQEREELEETLHPGAAASRRRYIRELCVLMVTAICLLLATSLIGDVINESTNTPPPSVNYPMFSLVWAWIALAVTFAQYQGLISVTTQLFWNFSAAFFIFCAAVELAAELSVHSCFNDEYIQNTNVITGSSNLTKRCQELQASDAFLWFTFTCFVIITAMHWV